MAKGIAHLGLFITLGLSSGYSHALSVSDLLITEIMANPSASTDARGEWLELYNPTVQPINLFDITIGDDGGDRHRFDSDLLILPGEYLTLARSTDPGFSPDYVYRGFALSNSSDEIVFRQGAMELLRLDYDSAFVAAGRSSELIALPMQISNYGLTLASLEFGAGDIGTPGATGSVSFAPSVVPLPASAWLFISGILAVLSPTLLPKVIVSPLRSSPTSLRRSREAQLS